jgi:hypothetical protein
MAIGRYGMTEQDSNITELTLSRKRSSRSLGTQFIAESTFVGWLG